MPLPPTMPPRHSGPGRNVHARSRLALLHPRIKWAQAHGTREALDRQFRLAELVFYPAAETPCLGQIGIEHKRAID